MRDLTSAETAEEAKKFSEVIKKRPMRAFRIEFGTDSTSDPAVTAVIQSLAGSALLWTGAMAIGSRSHA